ncbi:MAG: hypothetical protein GXY13_11110 [Acidimicrobiales bacterium]|nr:hypothetical protein [Acidimicrobiales bacterium]
MLTTFWSVKGGVGCTVTAATSAVVCSRDPSSADGVVIADLAGDVPATLGLPDPGAPGLAEWLAAGETVAADALSRMELGVAPGLVLLPRGRVPIVDPERVAVLASLLAADSRDVVVDAGVVTASGPLLPLARDAHRSLLVVRNCYLGLRRAVAPPVQPSGLVLVREPGRSLTRRDVESCIAAPVVADVEVDRAMARAVDAGLLLHRTPRAVAAALRGAA